MLMIRKILSTLFSIKNNEWERVLYFFLVLLVFFFGASFARSIGITLLVENLGGDKLPIAFICIDLAVMIGSIVYAHYTKRVSGIAILGFLLLSTTVFALGTQGLFIIGYHYPELFRWVYGFFFVGFFFFYILFSIHVNSVVASYFTAVQIKRVTGFINTGIPIGGVLGGSSLVILLNVFGLEPKILVWVLGGTCLCAFWLVRRIDTRVSPIRTSYPEYRSNKTPFQELSHAFKYILSSRLMIFMSLGLIVFVVGNKLLEYHYQVIVYPQIFPESTKRATFFATYEIFANLGWLFVQLFLTSRFINSLGVGASNLVYPALSATVALVLFSYFFWYPSQSSTADGFVMLGLAVVSQFINQEMRIAVRTPLNNLLFNAIPPNQWGTNRAFLNGIAYPLATYIAGTFLILISGMGTDSATLALLSYLLPLIVFITSVLGIIIALPQWSAYDAGVFGLLNRELFDRRLDINAANNSSNLKQVLQEKLNSTDYYQVVAALEMIRLLRLNFFANQVGNLLLQTKTFAIKEHCLNTLAALPQSPINISYLTEALETEKNPDVLPLILRNLANFKSTHLNTTVEKFLNHPVPAVFVSACLYLYKHPHYVPKKEIEKRLLARLMTSSSANLPLYLQALSELRQPHHSETILPFLDDDLLEVRVAAFIAYVHLLEGRLNPYKSRLIDALNSSSKEMKVTALRALKECQPLEDWTPVIRLLGARDRVIVNESKELLRLNLYACRNALISQVFSGTLTVQQRFEILSLIYPKLNELQRRHLQEIADTALKNFVQMNSLLNIHQAMPDSNKVHGLIAKVLQEIAESHLLTVITVITYTADQSVEFFQRVSRGLLSLSRANQGNALEVLSNAGEKYLVGRVLKYFEERLVDIEGFSHIYTLLFAESLDINASNYEAHLWKLEHDMLRACLLYLEKERTGSLKLEHSNRKICVLLTEKRPITQHYA